MTNPQTHGHGEDPLFVAGMATALVVLVCWIAWYMWHAQLVYWSLRIDWWLLGAVDWTWSPIWVAATRQHMAEMAAYARTAPFVPFVMLANKASVVTLPVLLGATGALALKVHRDRSNRVRRVIDVDTLPWIVAKHAPANIPALYYGDLLNSDPKEHRSALTPEEWAIKHKLVLNRRLDRDKAYKALLRMLGKKASKPTDLQPHERALYAVFAARLFSAGEDYAAAQQLLDELNYSCHRGTYKGKRGYPDLRVARPLFVKYADHTAAREWFSAHPYRRTLLLAMHEAAINRGRLPTSNFRWLKGMDRELWYALDTTGRKVPWVESLAVFTQSRWETYVSNLGMALREPYLDDALDALEAYLAKVDVIQPPPKKRSL